MPFTDRAIERAPGSMDRGGDLPPLLHRYPRDPRYRLSLTSPPQPGDIARCGWVKKVPNSANYYPPSAPRCIVCEELARGAS